MQRLVETPECRGQGIGNRRRLPTHVNKPGRTYQGRQVGVHHRLLRLVRRDETFRRNRDVVISTPHKDSAARPARNAPAPNSNPPQNPRSSPACAPPGPRPAYQSNPTPGSGSPAVPADNSWNSRGSGVSRKIRIGSPALPPCRSMPPAVQGQFRYQAPQIAFHDSWE